MMSNITYLNGWRPELCIQLKTPDNNQADFNRFLVKGFPPTKQLQEGGQFTDAGRESFILRLKDRFVEIIEEGGSHSSLSSSFNQFSQYLKWCDEEKYLAFTQNSLESYMAHLQIKVMLGKIKGGTYKVQRSTMTRLFIRFLDFPHHFFDNVVIMDNKDVEPFEAYTRSDLNKLLPFLRSVFKQTYQQFIKSPDKYIRANRNTQTMTFNWEGKTYNLCASISKMMCAGTYLLAYYTYANTSDLFQLKQPNNASTALGEIWYTMPAFKRRAFKTIQVEMGCHELEIPKYAMNFFDNLLNASRIIGADRSVHLLQTIISKQVSPIKSVSLQSFNKNWIEKHFAFTDQTGCRLRPVISRFRETGAQLTAYHQGNMVNDIMLNNTSSTRKRHYSNGNKLANNGMIQDVMSIKEEQVKSGTNAKLAQKSLGITVLVIEEENKISIPGLSRTSNGGSCASPFGEKSKKYTMKAMKQGLAKEGERLACADLLGCFGCPDQVIVQSLADIWCLLSFKACIEESLYLHLDASHYRKNFEYIVQFIESQILPNINTRILKQAEKKFDDNGFHPLWDDSESVLHLSQNSIARYSNGCI